jgi:uncharacterized protein (TIGR03437 family)
MRKPIRFALGLTFIGFFIWSSIFLQPSIERATARVGNLLSLKLAEASAQSCSSTQIDILPSNPTTNDNVTIRLSGTWSDACTPRNPAVTVVGGEIRINTSNPGQVCAQVITPWNLSLTIPAGSLAARTYQVIATHSYPSGQCELGRRSFTVGSQTVTVVAHTMSGGPSPGCPVPPTPKFNFAPTDARAYQWTRYSGVRAGDFVRVDYIQPNGTLYYSDQGTLTLSGDVCVTSWMDIASQPAASLPGNWQARVYYNGVLVVTENFTITGPVNPAPTLTTLSPNSALAGGPSFTLAVTGSNFVPGSVVQWNGSLRQTTFVSPTQLLAVIAASDIAVASTASVTVVNPAPGGGVSNALSFTITPAVACPTVSRLNPASGVAGSQVTINGANFTGVSAVRFANNVAAQFTVNSDSQITATVPNGAVTGPITISKPNCPDLTTATFTVVSDPPPAGAVVIIDGTDANEHGSASGGVNRNGWLYMQKAMENLAARVSTGPAKVVVDLGSSSGTARNAINSAFNLSSLPGAGWTITHVDGAANITNWLANLSTANTGILYIPTYNLTGGDLDAQEMAAINAQASRIADFMNLSPSGALFAMGELGAGSWDWLRALYPGIVVTDISGSGVTSSITLTPDGMSAFPGLTNADMAGADPWHNYFTGDLATLKVLATAPQSGTTRQVILGGVGIRPPPPTPSRVVRTVCAPASRGGTVTVPITLDSQGDENALGFSLNFDLAVLTYVQTAIGSDAAGATLNENTSQVGQGRLGVALTLPSGRTFAAGARQIAVITFNVSSSTTAPSTPVGFGDAPIRREVSNVNAQVLSAGYQGCTIEFRDGGYEADVAPRPNGNNDGAVTITDWVQVGRFSAGLDTAAAGSEFQRADCAPRETKGNGQLSITDWVQAGRYAAGLDPVQTSGGPASPTALALVPDDDTTRNASAHPRVVRILNATFQRGQPNTLELEIEAEGDENAFGLSLNFDPSVLAFVSASAGSGAPNAVLNVNSNQAASGRLGIALALPAGQTLRAGKQIVVTVRFNSLTGNNAATTIIGFGDAPIRRQLSDVNAVAVAASYSDGSVNFVNSIANVSAASFRPEIAAESIVAAFGASLATTTAAATTLPLPTSLAGTTVKVKDSVGVERLAPLFFIAPTQVNYLAPPEAAPGAATVTVTSGNGTVSVGTINIATVAPSLFTANADGQGVGAMVVVRIKADGSQVFESAARFDPAQQQFVAAPIDLGSANEQVVLLMFGTGLRNRSALSAVSVNIGGVNAPVCYAGSQPDFAGLDQLNVQLPRNLAGRGEVDVVVTVDGRTANTIKAFIK